MKIIYKLFALSFLMIVSFISTAGWENKFTYKSKEGYFLFLDANRIYDPYIHIPPPNFDYFYPTNATIESLLNDSLAILNWDKCVRVLKFSRRAELKKMSQINTNTNDSNGCNLKKFYLLKVKIYYKEYFDQYDAIAGVKDFSLKRKEGAAINVHIEKGKEIIPLKIVLLK